MDTKPYSEPDAGAFYHWLRHRASTEAVALHPEFRPGREHRDWNRSHRAYPRISYIDNLAALHAFIGQHHGTHMVAVGYNERPRPLRNEHGYFRAARESEIETVSNFLLDIDFEGEAPTRTQKDELSTFVRGAVADYFHTLGPWPFAYGVTGNGQHILLPIPPTKVSDYPDIAQRYSHFVRQFREDQSDKLASLECRVDSTHSLRGMVKVYGTEKPGREGLSRFYGSERQEDPTFLEHLLSLKMEVSEASCSTRLSPSYGPSLLTIYDRPPASFATARKLDKKLDDYWEGRGKPENSDTSSSGYDISLIRRWMMLGERNIDFFATVLVHRPRGSVQMSGKGEDYIRRTIARALAG